MNLPSLKPNPYWPGGKLWPSTLSFTSVIKKPLYLVCTSPEYPAVSTRPARTSLPESLNPAEFLTWVVADCPRKKYVLGTTFLTSVGFNTPELDCAANGSAHRTHRAEIKNTGNARFMDFSLTMHCNFPNHEKLTVWRVQNTTEPCKRP